MLKLDVIVIGGGLAGLASATALASDGHRVRLFEKSSGFPTTPGAIRVPPNAAKVLAHWGLHDQLSQKSALLSEIPLCDMHTGDLIALTAWKPEMYRDSGGDFRVMAFDALYTMLHDYAVSKGAEITFNAPVASVAPPPPPSTDPAPTSDLGAGPSVTLATGEVLHADLIVGADGIHSTVREALNEASPAQHAYSGRSVYTGILEEHVIESDPGMKHLARARQMLWFGNDCFGIGYPLPTQKAWGLHVDLPDPPDEDASAARDWEYIAPSSVDCAHLEPRLQYFFKHARTLARGRYVDRAPAQSWVDPQRRMLLVGQAAHPSFWCAPYLTADCLESACVLSTLLAHLRVPAQLPSILYAYEEIHAPRAARLHDTERSYRLYVTLSGAARAARDAELRASITATEAAEVARRHAEKREGSMYGSGSGSGSRGARSVCSAEGGASASAPPEEEEDDEGEDEDEGLGELAQQYAENAELWGYDARDAAEDWWVKWGMLRERTLFTPEELARFSCALQVRVDH